MREDPFLELVSIPQPIPGGGAVAAHTALLGLALLEKIVRLESSRANLTSERREIWSDLLGRVHSSVAAFARLRDEDGAAYMRMTALRTSGADDKETEAALDEAVQCPLLIIGAVAAALDIVLIAGRHCKPHLLSDLLVVAELLHAVGRGAYHITSANLGMASYAAKWKNLHKELDQALDAANRAFKNSEAVVAARQKT